MQFYCLFVFSQNSCFPAVPLASAMKNVDLKKILGEGVGGALIRHFFYFKGDEFYVSPPPLKNPCCLAPNAVGLMKFHSWGGCSGGVVHLWLKLTVPDSRPT